MIVHPAPLDDEAMVGGTVVTLDARAFHESAPLLPVLLLGAPPPRGPLPGKGAPPVHIRHFEFKLELAWLQRTGQYALDRAAVLRAGRAGT